MSEIKTRHAKDLFKNKDIDDLKTPKTCTLDELKKGIDEGTIFDVVNLGSQIRAKRKITKTNTRKRFKRLSVRN